MKIIMTNQRLKRYRNCDLFHLIDVITINGSVACVFHILLAELSPPTAEKNARKLYFTIIKVNAVYHHIFSLEYLYPSYGSPPAQTPLKQHFIIYNTHGFTVDIQNVPQNIH